MADDPNGGWPQRAPVDRGRLHAILDHILDLQERTDPDSCPDPSAPSCEPADNSLWPDGDEVIFHTGKDAAAHVALHNAFRLVEEAAGWAVSHRAGRALRESASSGEDGDSLTADAHEHEARGASLQGELEGDGPEADAAVRQVLSETLLWVAGAWGHNIAAPTRELREGLQALDYGEVQPLLRPAPGKRSGQSWTLWRHRLRACEHLRFQVGYGIAEGVAAERVASAYGQSVDAIRKWTSRVNGQFPGARKEIEDAHRAGAQKYDLESKHRRGVEGTEVDGLLKAITHVLDGNMERDGEVYIQSLKGG